MENLGLLHFMCLKFRDIEAPENLLESQWREKGNTDVRRPLEGDSGLIRVGVGWMARRSKSCKVKEESQRKEG